ncbi:MAG: site-specific DNA-methyltransferase, partial [Candidatus Aenigmatarchaeota archaeon]
GWLIRSENYQALNTILPKFREKVQTIYIDPPFNKEQNADYLYNVKYKDSTWASMLENRLRLARELLKDTGSIFVRCDYNGNWIVRPLMDEIFGKENFRNEIIVTRGEYPKGEVNKLRTGNDNILFYARSDKNVFVAPRKKREERKWFSMHLAGERGSYELQVREFFGKKLLPPKGRHWMISQEKINELIEKGEIRINENKTYIDLQGNLVVGEPEMLQSEFEVLDSNWTDIQSYSAGWCFRTENSEILLKRVIESTSNEGDLVMDFFLGSGTTTAVAHKLKRKWIGVEMGEHFYSVVLPRMKKVLFYDDSGISDEKNVKEKYNKYNAGGFFKYYELEQYADVLDKTKYEDNIFENDSNYVYMFMSDRKLAANFDNANKVELSKLYNNIDIEESISNVLGKRLKKVFRDKFVLEDGEEILKDKIPINYLRKLIWWD